MSHGANRVVDNHIELINIGTKTHEQIDTHINNSDIHGSLSNIVEDTTPQLGGSLDALTNDINNLGDLIPNADDTQDLGTSLLRWKDLYLGPQSLHVGSINLTEDNGTLKVDSEVEVLGEVIPIGIRWDIHTAAAANGWLSVTYGNGLFVAVSYSGSGNRVMTSPDGITWTSRTSAADNSWASICYGNGLFVAVSEDGTYRVMTSPDGITWTSRTAAAANVWRSITFGNGLFVATSSTGSNNRVMTSPDGITWTSRTSAQDNGWYSVTYGNGLFVAVSISGTNQVMTSPNGINWTVRTAIFNSWRSVTYGNGLFVAVSYSGSSNRVMTSPDGITWTSRTSAQDNSWYSVTYGDDLFVAVSIDGTGDRVMTSPDGITWTSRTSAEDNQWRSITFGDGLFVAVSSGGTNRVMTSAEFINTGLTLGTGSDDAQDLLSVDVTGDPKLTWNEDQDSFELNKPLKAELKDYSETSSSPSSTSGTLILDIENGNTFVVILTENVTTFNFNNPSPTGKVCNITLILTQDSTPRTITWPSSVKWDSGTAPTINTASAVYILTYMTVDAGTTWYGVLSGSEMA